MQVPTKKRQPLAILESASKARLGNLERSLGMEALYGFEKPSDTVRPEDRLGRMNE
jgi:hypothetical protein